MKRVLLLITLPVFLAGCDLFSGEEDTEVVATGTVVFAETGAPIEGLGVSLDSISGVSHLTVETVQTDTQGRFDLSYDTGGRSVNFRVVVNNNSSSALFTVRTFVVNAGDDRDFGVIELSRIED